MSTNSLHSQSALIRLLLVELAGSHSTILSKSIAQKYSSERVGTAKDEDLSAMAADLLKELSAFRAQTARHQTNAFQENILAVTLGSIGEAVITLDTSGRIVLFNNAAETLTEWSFKEAEGKPIEKVVNAFDEKDPARQITNFIEVCCASKERKAEIHCMVRSRSGKEKAIACQGFNIREQDRDLGTALVLRDITQSSLVEEELLKIRKLESVGVMAGGIAHDFNNLLTGITTYLFMAKVSVSGNVEASMLIGEAEKAAFKASILTKQLLSFSKGGPSIREITQVKQLIQDTVGFSLSGSNVDYRLEISDDLALIEVDKGQIDQALNSILVNAMQAMPDGGTVTIGADNFIVEANNSVSMKPLPLPVGRYIRISIKDEGVGIPRENLEHLFDPYFTTKKESSGLGLATAYSIIKKHGGHILVESTEGVGSVFSLFLPVASTRANGKASRKDPPKYKGTGKVLIMDDDMIVRTVVETLLKKAGYSPLCTTNGKEALEKYKEASSKGEPFIVTIMDLTIPGGMGGKETVKKLREFDPDAKVIVFSGYSNDKIITNYKEYGFDGVLSKPFSIDEFMQTITSVLHLPDHGQTPL
jgi:PAS domain S-box-containing protein